jgi:hypothetical protein
MAPTSEPAPPARHVPRPLSPRLYTLLVPLAVFSAACAKPPAAPAAAALPAAAAALVPPPLPALPDEPHLAS